MSISWTSTARYKRKKRDSLDGLFEMAETANLKAVLDFVVYFVLQGISGWLKLSDAVRKTALRIVWKFGVKMKYIMG